MIKKRQDLVVFLTIAAAMCVLYNGFQKNYFFSDDFQWLSQAILVEDSASELFQIQGRDFNPLLTLLFWVLVKIGGLYPLIFRALCFLSFSGALFLFYYLLKRYFKVNPAVAICAALLCGFNVYISEVMLYLSTFVYSLTLLLFFIALKFYLDGKKILYILFMLLAFQFKETIILALVPLILYERRRNNRIFIGITGAAVFLSRFLFQAGSTTSYTHFATTENLLYKLYFLTLYPMNLSPYAVELLVGIAAVFLLLIVFVYFLRTSRHALFFAGLFVVFVLFFSFLPKVSSKYYFYPAFGFWGLAALLGSHLYQKSKYTRYLLFSLLAISLVLNYPALKREIEDYRILGDFSKTFIQDQAKLIKARADVVEKSLGLRIDKPGLAPLSRVYKKIYDRQNMLKLLPFRKHSIGGLIPPSSLIPIVFYPEKIVRWQPIEETEDYFMGRCITSSGE